MDRRDFLRTAAGAGLASGFALDPASAAAQTSDQLAHPQAGSNVQTAAGLPPTLMGAAALDGYLDEARLRQALGIQELRRPTGVKVIAFNFPSWHPSPWMEARFGEGWTEFDTLRNARPLFPGHSMPRYPLWGYYDEADPVWAAREIDLAADHGIDAWMIDWYWHDGTQFYQEQLERGMLRAPNRDRLQFALMWANHDWKNVYPARSPNDAATLLPQTHSLPDFVRVADYCCEHYFSQSNYLRLNGAPLFAIFDLGKLVNQLGPDGPRRATDLFRERCRKLGFSAMHLQIVGGYDHAMPQLGAFGFDSATQYGTFGWSYGVKPPGSRLPYGMGALEGIDSWHTARQSLRIPFHPCVSVGWDDSPRFGEFASIAINRSPDQFERALRAARHNVAGDGANKLVYIAAWNEWTEDHVLLPDTLWGYSYLEAVHRALKT